MKIVSIIPIKLKNERLNGKNVKILAGKPLMQHIQETLVTIPDIAERYVYCSNEAVEEYLLPEVTFKKRPEVLDLDTSNFTQIFSQFSSEVDADIYVYAHATAPFVTAESICACIEAVKSGEYDSAFTAVKIQDYLWTDGKPLNFDPANIPRSQDLPCVYRETSGVYVFTKESFEKCQRRVGYHPYVQEVSFKEAIDINYPEDFALAEAMIT